MECDNMKKRDSHPSQMQEPSIETDKLSYEIFSILESKFLFGYDDQKLWLQKQIAGAGMDTKQDVSPPTPPPPADSGNITSIKNQRGKVCILSIDGGGMRGIISGKALAYLEQALKTKSGDADARIADYFDIAAGTGMGGVFTAMLFSGNSADNRPVYRADDTWKFLAEQSKGFFRGFHRGGGGIFRRIVKGNKRPQTGTATGGMEKAMKGLFSSTTLKDTLKPVLIPCYDLSTSAPFLFSRADALETGSFDFRLWEVCRATSAEPGVFEPMAMKSTDGATRCVGVNGGLAMCNPAAAAITHVLHNKQEFPFVRGVEDLLVLSLGSGQLMEANYEYEQVKGWKAREWAGPTARIAGDSAADLVDHAVAMAFGQSGSGNYVRIQANGSKVGRWQANVDSDPSLSNVKMMMGVADEMLEQKNVGSLLFGGKKVDELTNAQKLDWFAGELVLEHQRRGCRIAPTVAFKQSTQTLT